MSLVFAAPKRPHESGSESVSESESEELQGPPLKLHELSFVIRDGSTLKTKYVYTESLKDLGWVREYLKGVQNNHDWGNYSLDVDFLDDPSSNFALLVVFTSDLQLIVGYCLRTEENLTALEIKTEFEGKQLARQLLELLVRKDGASVYKSGGNRSLHKPVFKKLGYKAIKNSNNPDETIFTTTD